MKRLMSIIFLLTSITTYAGSSVIWNSDGSSSTIQSTDHGAIIWNSDGSSSTIVTD